GAPYRAFRSALEKTPDPFQTLCPRRRGTLRRAVDSRDLDPATRLTQMLFKCMKVGFVDRLRQVQPGHVIDYQWCAQGFPSVEHRKQGIDFTMQQHVPAQRPDPLGEATQVLRIAVAWQMPHQVEANAPHPTVV